MTGAELLARHPGEWRAATSHPFLDGVREGSLPEAALAAWLVQDHHFVLDLLRFQSRLLAVAPRTAQRVLASGLVALEGELTWMESHAGRLGQDLEAAPHATTLAYRSHLEALLEAGPVSALSGLWTLERAYFEAWRGAAPGHPRYRELVDHWTAPEFEGYVEQLEEAAVRAGLDEPAFLETARLERDFWEMAWAS